MHVLMVAERVAPSVGGVEKHIAGILEMLQSKGYDVTLVAPGTSAIPSSAESSTACPVVRIPVRFSTRLKYPAAWRWWIRCRALVADADILHFHDVYALLHWFGPLHALFPRKPRFLTYHGYEMDYPIPRRARFYRMLADRLARGSIAVGHYLPKWFALCPDAITYGGVDLPEQVFPLPKTHKALFVGRLARDTGIHTYIKALEILQARHGLSVPLLVCGDGPARESAEREARVAGVPTTFLGFQESPEPFYRECSISFAPGYLAMLEAMVHRRPVFCVFHTPVKADYLRMMPQSDSLFTTSSSPEALAASLKHFIAGDGRFEEKIENAFQFAGAQTWERLADTYDSLWTSAFHMHGQGRRAPLP